MDPDGTQKPEEILTSREVLYARAAASVNTSRRTLEESLADITDAIKDHGFLADA